MRLFLVFIYLFVISFTLSFCDSKVNPKTNLISLPMKTIDGNTVRLTDFKNKVVVLDFWATWCEPCVKAVPVLNQWKASLSADEFVFLGINTDEGTELAKIKEDLKILKMNYPTILDPDWKLSENYDVDGIPTLLVFNRKGELVYRQSGLIASDLPGLLLRSKVWMLCDDCAMQK
ncbi:TlpA family protein disulfide reductase [Leptospira ognonensis]|uniref:TlpA family protein disulfide reductase n=1 Tax=Leptospira ognonensis TaxID=2484945 RepID=A0A4R9JWJ4_9LEPT|nr:TlpA disulfide reductase family protein [Leptospira ognonensis]TGL57390.1 TlpA family protein disulfide reductase [Leptospira ognonensis]